MAIREWIVFFGDGERAAWWDFITRPGFRHVLAVGWDAELRLFVMFDPARERSEVLLRAWGKEDLDLAGLLSVCRHAVRFRPRNERSLTPAFFGCVGAIKALLGIKAPCALAPYGLYRHLLRNGGEAVELPSGQPDETEDAEGGSASGGDAAP